MINHIQLLKCRPLDQPKTAIIATVGGQENYDRNYLWELIENGTDIVRINLSHVKDHKNPESSSYKHIQQIIKDLDEITAEKRRIVALLFDIGGPKIRVGNLQDPITIEDNDELYLIPENAKAELRDGSKVVPVTYDRLKFDVHPGHRILVNDGKIELEVMKIEQGRIKVNVKASSEKKIESNNGINLPDSKVSEPTLTEADLDTIRILAELGISKSVDFLGQSFVRIPSDLAVLENQAKIFFKTLDVINNKIVIPGIIAKIETWEAVKKDLSGNYIFLDNILKTSSGVMVARGDLAGETSPDEVPVIQSYLSKKGIEMGKAVIIATQMLASMTEKGNKRPRRSEASDVANAVFDYVDAVMLSEETAKGQNPSLCVKTMRDILLKAERFQMTEKKSLELLSLFTDQVKSLLCKVEERETITRQLAIAEAAISFANNLKSPAIVVSTSSGDTAIRISRYRPTQPIIAFTDIEKSARKMLLYRGIYPFLIEKKPQNFEAVISVYKGILRKMKVGDKNLIDPQNGEKVLLPLTLGIQPEESGSVAASGNTNTVYILDF
jgi:pyruvate kinase